MADENPIPPPDQKQPLKINVTVDDMALPPPPDPNTPVAFSMAIEQGRSVAKALRDDGCPLFLCWVAYAITAGPLMVIAVAGTAITWALVNIATPVGMQFLEALEGMRKGIDPVIPKMASEILGELTGADIKPEHVPTGKGFADHLARVTAVGDEMHDLLVKEFAPDGAISPAQGAQAARAFTGFNINFGIGTAMIALLGEIGSLGKLEQVRELGVEVSRNLGLGRLHRQALQPLIHTLIANPYQEALNEQYRPTRLNVGQLIKAFFRKAIDDPTVRSELALAGYNEERINLIISDARPIFSDAEIIEHYFRGFIKEETLKASLQQHGWEDFQIDGVVLLHRPRLEKTEIIHLYEGGEIELPEALALLGQLGYDDQNAHRVITSYELAHQPSVKIPRFHTKHLSVGELHKLYIDRIIDLSTYQTKLQILGFSAEDASLLEQQVVFDQAHAKSADAIHAAPHLSLAQLKAALVQGIMSAPDVTAHLHALGYSDTDAAVILAEFEAAASKTASKAPPAPAG